jgi:hypothetical protein
MSGRPGGYVGQDFGELSRAAVLDWARGKTQELFDILHVSHALRDAFFVGPISAEKNLS